MLIDGDRMTISWPSRGVKQTKDIGASQRRVQKYFVDSSPAELRSHFEIDRTREPNGRAIVVTMVPKRKQIKEGLRGSSLAIDADIAADDGDEDDVPERRHQADDVHRREARTPPIDPALIASTPAADLSSAPKTRRPGGIDAAQSQTVARRFSRR